MYTNRKIINSILNVDCLDGFKKIRDKSIDIIITSPPYNLGNIHHCGSDTFKPYDEYNDNMDENKYQNWQLDILRECFRVLKDTGSMFYNHKNRIKQGVQISPYKWILKSDFILKQELVWINGGQNFDKIRFYPMTERIYWLVKDRKTKLENKINHHDVFNWKASGRNMYHKRSFPINLVTDILKCFDKGVVLDPFMGSGTTAIGCIIEGFDYIGFEISAEYCNSATILIKKQLDGNLYNKSNIVTEDYLFSDLK